MRSMSNLIGKYMAVIVLAVSVLALFLPETCLWIQTGWINYLLMIVMFGMGLTMNAEDFAIVFIFIILNQKFFECGHVIFRDNKQTACL